MGRVGMGRKGKKNSAETIAKIRKACIGFKDSGVVPK
jgi:hypothetical protein